MTTPLDWSAYYDRVQSVVFWVAMVIVLIALFVDEETGAAGLVLLALIALCTLASMSVWS